MTGTEVNGMVLWRRREHKCFMGGRMTCCGGRMAGMGVNGLVMWRRGILAPW